MCHIYESMNVDGTYIYITTQYYVQHVQCTWSCMCMHAVLMLILCAYMHACILYTLHTCVPDLTTLVYYMYSFHACMVQYDNSGP